uniref:Zinc fingers and homeoboxes 2 n=1 Tax=Xiphophorus couchianus TaxID=32473 RepID=A0A3B5MFT2_9TELE
MSSRRKASTPCMIRPEQTQLEEDDDEEESHNMEAGALFFCPDKPQKEPPDPSKPQRRQQGGYECKYCPFSTQNLNTFKEHVDSNHPNVILNPLYLCAVCNFNTKKFDTLTEHNERCHPGESNFKFKRIKMNNQTILEQTIEGCSNNAVIYNTLGSLPGKGDRLGSSSLSKTNTVKTAKPKTLSTDIKRTELQMGKLTPELAKKPITALNVNGTVIIPESTLLKADSLSHIMPSLQQPINYTQVPKIAVPLNTTKYNPSLDDNLTLISSFNKFPYPTQAELSWLTAASKHPEEQIKVWFTTQRLKQGISWSPEEVEEARKKMFNGTISSVPQTLTVVASQLAASVLQSLPCQIPGQNSLVLTPVANGSSVTCTPLALTVASQVAQSLKRTLATPVIATESKRPSIIQTIHASTATSKLAPPKMLTFTADPNKTAEQLSVLRSSYTQCPFPEEDEIYRLIETTGLSRGEIKKWFSEQRLLNLKSVASPPVLVKAEAAPAVLDGPVKKAVPSQFPLLERVKGKSSEQLKALEESFQRSSSPTEKELDQLAQETRLSKTEVDCWFLERRALRDNMEKVLLTMACRNMEDRLERAGGALLNGAKLMSKLPPAPQLQLNYLMHMLCFYPQMFCRTQWPSPEEYSQLELQTKLGRTDIVRWFKDHRSALKNGETLDWMDAVQKQSPAEEQNAGQHQNGQISNDNQALSLEVKALNGESRRRTFCSLFDSLLFHRSEESGGNVAAGEDSKLSGQDKGRRLAKQLAQGVSNLSRTGQDQNSCGASDKGR